MNSVIDEPRRSECHPDAIAQWLTQFDGAQARHLQKVAGDIARKLYRGCFGNAADFDVIALETRHGSR